MSAPLPSGTSELDTAVLRLVDAGVEVTNWSRYQFNRAFLTPTAEWSFAVNDGDPGLTASLVPGARVQLVVGGRIQCTGTVDRRQVAGSARDGTTVTVRGRDLLGRVVDATMDPAFKFSATTSVPQLVAAVLAPFNIGVIYNSDAANVNVMTGYPAGQGSSVTSVTTQTPSVVDDATGKTVLSFTPGTTKLVQSGTRPDLALFTVQEVKPHNGEGVFAFLDRLLRRLGLKLWAAADGSGVIIDEPDFLTPPRYQIVRKRSDPSQNNVEWGEVVTDLSTQPSVIVAFGFGGGPNVTATRLKVAMVNELVGVGTNGQPIPSVTAILARYQGAKVLPLRSSPAPLPSPGYAPPAPPFFVKDDEAHDLAQLEAFVRRKMAEHQSKAVVGTYELAGHTQDTHPWSVNTSVGVTDDVGGLARTMWIQEVTMTKTPGPGTKTQLKTILPFTLQLGSS